MKPTLTIILFLVCMTGMGQDSVKFIDNTKTAYPMPMGHFTLEVRTTDTIPVIMLVCDTTNNSHYINGYNRAVRWEKGYKVYDIPCIYLMGDANVKCYLDSEKNPMKKFVLMSKTL